MDTIKWDHSVKSCRKLRHWEKTSHWIWLPWGHFSPLRAFSVMGSARSLIQIWLNGEEEEIRSEWSTGKLGDDGNEKKSRRAMDGMAWSQEFCPLRDIWQCLATLQSATGIWWVTARVAAKHLAIHRTAPYNKELSSIKQWWCPKYQ